MLLIFSLFYFFGIILEFFYIERCVSRDKQQLQGKRGKYFNIGNNNEYSREKNTWKGII